MHRTIGACMIGLRDLDCVSQNPGLFWSHYRNGFCMGGIHSSILLEVVLASFGLVL